MSLDHEFGIVEWEHSIYLDRKIWRKLGSDELRGLMKDPVTIHDEVLSYLADTLRWIPCYNPELSLWHQGLNGYGITIVSPDGAKIAASILETWTALFRLGPPELNLTGSYGTVVGSTEPGHYAALVLGRDELVAKLSSLAQQCRRVQTNPEKSFILHLGI